MTFVLVQRGVWGGVEADIYLDARAAAAFFTAAHAYMAETGRGMPEIVEPLGGLRTIAQTTEMQWAFDHRGTAASDAIYQKYNMSRVSTARPSINGTHTTGLFFDVATAPFLSWILAGNGARYGITRPLPNDPNHCQVSPGSETVALDVTSLDNSPAAPTPEIPLKAGDTLKFLKIMLNPDTTEQHYLGVLINDQGVVVEKEDVQTGWNGVQPFVPNPKYLLMEKVYGAGLPIASYTFSNEEWALLESMIASWPAATSGTSGPVTVNAQVDVTPELITALKDPNVQTILVAAIQAAIKLPTKITAELS